MRYRKKFIRTYGIIFTYSTYLQKIAHFYRNIMYTYNIYIKSNIIKKIDNAYIRFVWGYISVLIFNINIQY